MTERPVSADALFGGGVKLLQPAAGSGYRANVDAILLAAFAGRGPRVARLAVDLGSGAGAVGLTLFHLGIAAKVEFIERDPFMAGLCQRNLEVNHWGDRGAVHCGDLAQPLAKIAPHLQHAAGLVVANPPYVAPSRDARLPSTGAAAARRQARRGELAPFVRSAADALGRRGRACFVYPAHALLELIVQVRAVGLEPKRLRFVHGKADRPARIVLLEVAFGKAGGLVPEASLIETDSEGRPTDEVARLLAHPGKEAARPS